MEFREDCVPKMPHSIPIETSLGRLFGRDCIFLDRFVFEDEKSTLVLEGCIGGKLCTIQQPDRFIPYILRFRGVLALKMMELDSTDWDGESSFDEVHDSEWIRELGGKVTPSKRHFFVQTYDYVFDVVCDGYEFEVHAAAGEPNGAPKN